MYEILYKETIHSYFAKWTIRLHVFPNQKDPIAKSALLSFKKNENYCFICSPKLIMP